MGGGDENERTVEPRRKESFVSNKYGSKTWGKKKKALAKNCKKTGAKSKLGKEPGQAKPDSSQLGIEKFFKLLERPEEIRIPIGIETSLQIPATKE